MQQRTQGDVTTTALLVCGAIAGPLFVVAFLIEGATRADYNPLRHPVSSLALGDDGEVELEAPQNPEPAASPEEPAAEAAAADEAAPAEPAAEQAVAEEPAKSEE